MSIIAIIPDDYADQAAAFAALNASADNDWTLRFKDGTYSGANNSGITLAPTVAGMQLALEAFTPNSVAVIFDGGSAAGWLGSTSANLAGFEILDITIQNYTRNDDGAAILFKGIASGCNVRIDTCKFLGNDANGYGGAIYCDSAHPHQGTVTILDSNFDGNTSTYATGVGGAAAFAYLALIDISATTFYNNLCPSNGGAISISASEVPISNITDCDFGHPVSAWGNKQNAAVANTLGGAISIDGADTGTLNLLRCNFYGNGHVSKTYWGGAVSAIKLAALNVTDCYFKTNTALYGGALYFSTGVYRGDRNNFDSNIANAYGGAQEIGKRTVGWNGALALDYRETNSRFYNNAANVAATTCGGAIYLNTTAGAGYYNYVINCTLVSNTNIYATRGGGGIYFARNASVPSLFVYNSIFWGNVSGAAVFVDIYNDHASDTVNVDYCDYSVGGIGGAGNSFIAHAITTDPLFVSASDHTLQALSPARNAGSKALIPAGITEDLLGAGRVKGLGVDMGCYEMPLLASIDGVLISSLTAFCGINLDVLQNIGGI